MSGARATPVCKVLMRQATNLAVMQVRTPHPASLVPIDVQSVKPGLLCAFSFDALTWLPKGNLSRHQSRFNDYLSGILCRTRNESCLASYLRRERPVRQIGLARKSASDTSSAIVSQNICAAGRFER